MKSLSGGQPVNVYQRGATALTVRRRWCGTLSVLSLLAALALFGFGIVAQAAVPAELGGLIMAPCLISALACVDWASWN